MEDKKEEQVALNKQAIYALQECYKSVKNDVKEIKDTLLKRPSWSVMLIITTLTTISASLIVFVVTR